MTMKDQSRYVFTFFWPQKEKQWIVGSELEPPVNPKKKCALEYPQPLLDGDNGPSMGVNVLNREDFDLNILNPKDPKTSPSWTSSVSKQTYCTAWQLRIRDKVYTMTALVPGSEIFLGTYFFEGAASITLDGATVGQAFCEEMGYN